MNIAEIHEHKNPNKIHFAKIVGYTTMVLNPSYTYVYAARALCGEREQATFILATDHEEEKLLWKLILWALLLCVGVLMVSSAISVVGS